MQAMNFTRGMNGGKELRMKIGKVKDVGELKGLLGVINTGTFHEESIIN